LKNISAHSPEAGWFCKLESMNSQQSLLILDLISL